MRDNSDDREVRLEEVAATVPSEASDVAHVVDAVAADTEAVASELDAEEIGMVAAYDRFPLWGKLILLALVVVVLGTLFGVWHDFYFRWFEIHTGTVNESGPYYGFWSGFGSDIGEATIIVGIFAAWRHHSCHVRGCARLGRQVAGTTYLACPKHNPTHKGSKRSVDVSVINAAHSAAKDRGQA